MPLTQEAKSALEKQLLDRQQALLNAISAGDYETYTSLCDESLTCFEPEAKSHLVTGLPFHKFYFDFGEQMGVRGVKPVQRDFNTMSGASPTSYVPDTVVSQETRVWQQFEDGWKNVHLHRSMMD